MGRAKSFLCCWQQILDDRKANMIAEVILEHALHQHVQLQVVGCVWQVDVSRSTPEQLVEEAVSHHCLLSSFQLAL